VALCLAAWLVFDGWQRDLLQLLALALAAASLTRPGDSERDDRSRRIERQLQRLEREIRVLTDLQLGGSGRRATPRVPSQPAGRRRGDAA
jgi:hypothetical protein